MAVGRANHPRGMHRLNLERRFNGNVYFIFRLAISYHTRQVCSKQQRHLSLLALIGINFLKKKKKSI